MPDTLHDPRLRQLLREADRALNELRHPQPGGRGAKEIMAALDILHKDIGRRTHDLWQQAASEVADSFDELTDLEDFEPATEDLQMLSVAPLPPEAPDLWVDRLQDLLALLDAPTEDTDAVALALEASRVQWATVGLTAAWAHFPQPIQVALLGLLSARCRWLCEHLAVALGPEKALDRLRVHRSETGLAMVIALQPDSEPESGTWRGDALHWWDMLTAGLTG